MARTCRSASVKLAAKRAEEAERVIKELEERMNERFDEIKEEFTDKISKHQSQFHYNDFVNENVNSAIKIDHTFEFNADALVDVIDGILKTAAIALNAGSAASVLAKPENLKVFSDLLNGIAQAIKTKSTTGANLTFSAQRLAPGFVAYTYISSTTIQDKATFGEESVTASSIMYAFSFSEKYALAISRWNSIISLTTIIDMLYSARVGLTERLMKNEYTIAEYSMLSEDFENAISKHKKELAALQAESSVNKILSKSLNAFKEQSVEEMNITPVIRGTSQEQALLSEALIYFEQRGDLYMGAEGDVRKLLQEISEK